MRRVFLLFLGADFFTFFGAAFFAGFFAAGAAALLLLLAAGAAGDPVDGLGLAAFFFGEAAFFFGLFALLADFGFAADDFGLAVFAFFAPVDAFFLLAAGAGADAGAVDVVAGLFVVAAAVTVAAVAGFLFGAFVGDGERFRLVPLADFGLLDDDAAFVFVPAAFFAGDFFFLPAADPFFFADAAPPTLNDPLAPAPFVCFKVLFFVPARKAVLRCWLAVVVLTLKLAKIYFKIAAFEAPRRSFNCVIACFIIAEYFGRLLVPVGFLLALAFLTADEPDGDDVVCAALSDVGPLRSVISFLFEK
jgi:hypothetical protein